MSSNSSESGQTIALPKGGGALHGIGETFSQVGLKLNQVGVASGEMKALLFETIRDEVGI